MFNHILIALDGSALAESALPHAAAIGRAFDSRITLLRVLERANGNETILPVDPLDWEMSRAEAQAYLEETAERFRDTGYHPQVETVLLEGPAADKIIGQARDSGADLILLSSHGRSGLTGAAIGSVLQKVILRSRTSMMVVRAYRREALWPEVMHYRRIVVPLDGSRRAEVVLSPAGILARHHGASLRLVHVVRKPEMPQREPHLSRNISLSEEATALNWQESGRYLEEIRSMLPAETASDLMISGNVSEKLQEIVEEEEADLVILCAHGYSEGTRRIYGSITTSFIMYGTAPLLVVQDLAPERMKPTQAELAARETKGH